jgi:hypothetical protein
MYADQHHEFSIVRPSLAAQAAVLSANSGMWKAGGLSTAMRWVCCLTLHRMIDLFVFGEHEMWKYALVRLITVYA